MRLNFKNHFTQCIVVLLLLKIAGCGNTDMKSEQAVKSLKVLNSDLINFTSKAGDTPELQILNLLVADTTAPFPLGLSDDGFVYLRNFDFELAKGSYSRNTTSGAFVKAGGYPGIKFDMGYKFENTEFLLDSFSVVIVPSGNNFPVIMKAFVVSGNDTIWRLRYSATLADGLPLSVRFSIVSALYNFSGNLERTRNENDGTLNFNASLESHKQLIFNTRLETIIGYSKQGYYFKNLIYSQKMFGHLLEGSCDYAAIDPTAADYAGSFNTHTKTALYENKQKVADLILATTENSELLDYHVRFSDGSTAELANYIPLLAKLLNLKY